MRRLSLVAVLSLVSCVSSPPSLPIAYPEDACWQSIMIRHRDAVELSRVETRFVSRGEMWRLEVDDRSGHGMIAVFDGDRLETTLPASGLRASDLDPRAIHRRLYEALPHAIYLGEDRLKERWCWRYEFRLSDTPRELWIDQENHLPRRYIVYGQDAMTDEAFFDIPESFPVRPEMFDPDLLSRGIDRLRARGGESGPASGPASTADGSREAASDAAPGGSPPPESSPTP